MTAFLWRLLILLNGALVFEVKSLMMPHFLTFALNKSATEPIQSARHSVELTYTSGVQLA